LPPGQPQGPGHASAPPFSPPMFEQVNVCPCERDSFLPFMPRTLPCLFGQGSVSPSFEGEMSFLPPLPKSPARRTWFFASQMRVLVPQMFFVVTSQSFYFDWSPPFVFCPPPYFSLTGTPPWPSSLSPSPCGTPKDAVDPMGPLLSRSLPHEFSLSLEGLAYGRPKSLPQSGPGFFFRLVFGVPVRAPHKPPTF